MLKGKPTLEQLLDRIDRLESLVHAKSSVRSSLPFAQMMERGNIQNDKRAREVLSRTFGSIAKTRGKAMLRALEESRALWK